MLSVLIVIAFILAGIYTLLFALVWFLFTQHPFATRTEEDTEPVVKFPVQKK